MNHERLEAAASDDERRIDDALRRAGQTQVFQLGEGARHDASRAFGRLFDGQAAVVVADHNTFAAAGSDVVEALRRDGRPCRDPWIFDEPHLKAEYDRVDALREGLASHDAVPVAVGSGTINDLVKLVAHQLGRRYMVVGTAASMDGYAAFGASITRHGSKQTFDCPAPAAVLADLEVIGRAPADMNAAGYGDLIAKSVAGADWLAAAALDVEPIDEPAWDMVQVRLPAWTADPVGVQRGDAKAVRSLMLGLTLSGCAMQWTKTSRPASGAEHQFSHLWDMQHHTHRGRSPWHGFKVSIGTLASSAIYEELLLLPLERLDVDRAVAAQPSLAEVEADIRSRFDQQELIDKALEETRIKYVSGERLRERLNRLRSVWPELRGRLRAHLPTFETLQRLLAEAGCPTSPDDIGIAPERFRNAFMQAYFIRRRFTVLDLAVEAGLLPWLLQRVFAGDRRRWNAASHSDTPPVPADAERFFHP